MITGSEEDYYDMPDWMRPTAAQIVTAHPTWVDMYPWYVPGDIILPMEQLLKGAGRSRVIGCVGTQHITINTKH
jgi:hypothetical protein